MARVSDSSQGSQEILNYRDRTQANVIGLLDLLDVSLSRTWYCFDALVKLIGLAGLFLFLYLELLKNRWKLG